MSQNSRGAGAGPAPAKDLYITAPPRGSLPPGNGGTRPRLYQAISWVPVKISASMPRITRLRAVAGRHRRQELSRPGGTAHGAGPGGRVNSRKSAASAHSLMARNFVPARLRWHHAPALSGAPSEADAYVTQS